MKKILFRSKINTKSNIKSQSITISLTSLALRTKLYSFNKPASKFWRHWFLKIKLLAIILILKLSFLKLFLSMRLKRNILIPFRKYVIRSLPIIRYHLTNYIRPIRVYRRLIIRKIFRKEIKRRPGEIKWKSLNLI